MNKTLAIIKPDGVEKNKIGGIIKIIEDNNFQIVNLRMLQLTEDSAKEFYQVHQERPFFLQLVKYMTSGKIVALELKKDNAVLSFRELIGSTDPSKAKENTIRRLYGTNKEMNVIHGSDSDENAEKEINFFFE